jgi:hypothetical protein
MLKIIVIYCKIQVYCVLSFRTRLTRKGDQVMYLSQRGFEFCYLCYVRKYEHVRWRSGKIFVFCWSPYIQVFVILWCTNYIHWVVTVQSVYILCNMIYMYTNLLDAVFILSLLKYQTSTCFGRISRPSSEDIIYVYICVCVCVRACACACVCGKLYLLYYCVYCQRAWLAIHARWESS